MYNRIGVLADTHCCYNDTATLEGILAEMSKSNLDLVVHLGDAIDCEGVSTHEKDEAGINVWDEIREWFCWADCLMECADRFAYIVGNHENRLFRESRRKPRVPLAQYLQDMEEHCDKIVPYNHHLDLGLNWIAVHGNCAPSTPGRAVAKEIIHYWQNVIMGHVHRWCTFDETHGVGPNARTITGVECPCSALPSQWYNGQDKLSWANWQVGWVMLERYRDTYRPIPFIHTEGMGPAPHILHPA